MDNERKLPYKVLTADDIRKRAHGWTLAGDVGLLAHLEEFSENINNKIRETQKCLHELLENYEEIYTKAGNVTNQFLALQNGQFVENRVYDEESPTEDKVEVKKKDEAEQGNVLLMQYKEAVEVGVKLLDTHFEELQLPPNSDSDEEDELSTGDTIIWRPKNPYADKKFPLLIGSQEWWVDDSLGLAGYQESLDAEGIISESDSDVESITSIEKKIKLSSSSSMENIKSTSVKPKFLESSSEDLFRLDRNENLKNGSCDFSSETSTLCEPNLVFSQERSSEKEKVCSDVNNISQSESTTETFKAVDNAFARKLMAKLVTVKSNTEDNGKKKVDEVTENSAPAKHEMVPADESVFDETDDNSDLFSGNVYDKLSPDKGLFFDAENNDQLFAGSNNLFFDSGIDLFKSDALNEPSSKVAMKKNQDTLNGLKDHQKEPNNLPPKNLVSDLFENLNDEDAFFVNPPVGNQRERGDVGKKSVPIVPPELKWENDERLFDRINNVVESDFPSLPGFLQDSEAVPGSKDTKEKEVSLSSEVKPSSKSELVDTTTKEGATVEEYPKTVAGGESPSSCFLSAKQSPDKLIDILGTTEDEDLFSTSSKLVKRTEFLEEEGASLFGDNIKEPDSISISSSRSSLFDDTTASKSRLASVFTKERGSRLGENLFREKDDHFSDGETKVGEKDFFGTSMKEKNFLFGDSDDGDDLFGSSKNEKNYFGGKALFEKTQERSEDAETREKEEHERKLDLSKSLMNDWTDDDLFKTPTSQESKLTKIIEKTPAKEVKETKNDIFLPSNENLFFEILGNGDEIFSVEKEPAQSIIKSPINLIINPSEIEAKKESIGKLNIPDNLKLKLETVAKHISPGGVKGKDEKGNGLETSWEPSSNLLKCPNRDRVRIPRRRRPQSRRARQEAIRNSDVHWEQPSSFNESCARTTHSGALKDEASSEPSPGLCYPLSPSTDEEDFFNVPQLDTNLEEDQSIFKGSLFQSSKNSKSEDNLLFDGAPVLSPLGSITGNETDKQEDKDIFFSSGTAKTELGLFEDDDENLFKSGKPEEKTGDSVLFRSQRKTPSFEGKSKSIFDADLDGDEDLFVGKSNVVLPRQSPGSKNKKDLVSSVEKKSQTFVDPLGLMSNEK